MNDLLLAALHSLGKPSTAADICDAAVGLARHAGWTQEQMAGVNSAQKVASALKKMSDPADMFVFATGVAKENGNDRKLWAPIREFDKSYPIPDPPTQESEHPLDEMTRPQHLAVFDQTDNLVYELQRQRRELRAFLDRQDDELARFRERVRRSLAAVGLPDTTTP